MNSLRAWSLFSGVGGFDVGATRAGIETPLVCERDQYARAVMRRHYPNATYIEDVRDVTADSAEQPTIIFGGFPCQDVSVAGKRTGLDGKRSGLFYEVLRILDETKPEWIVIENVPGLLSSNGGRDFAAVVYGLAKRGYGVCWRVLDSQYFGVPQRRRRIFIVGHFGDGRAASVLFEPEGSAGNTEPVATARSNAAGGAGGGVGAYRQRGFGDYVNDCKASTLKARDGKDATDLITYRRRDIADYIEDDATVALRAKNSADERQLIKTPIAFNSEQTPKTATGITPTLRAEYHAARQHLAAPRVGVRRLMPVECERLQGFDDGWTETGIDDSGATITISDTQRYKQMGNAVTVNVAEWIFNRLVAAHE